MIIVYIDGKRTNIFVSFMLTLKTKSYYRITWTQGSIVISCRPPLADKNQPEQPPAAWDLEEGVINHDEFIDIVGAGIEEHYRNPE